MKKSLCVTGVCLLLISPKLAWSLNVQLLRPQTGAVQGYQLHTSETLPKFDLSTGININLAHHPLEVVVVPGGRRGVVDQFVTADFLASYGIFDSLTLNIDMPLNLYHNIAPVLIPARDQGGGDAGDLLISAKWRIFDANQTSTHLGLALVPMISLPTGRQSIFFGNASVSGGAIAVGDFQWGANRIYANLGARFREDETLGNIAVKDEFLYGVGFERPLVKKWDLDIIAEAFGSTNFNHFFSRQEMVPVEIHGLLKKKWGADRRLVTQIGGGAGLTEGYGSPVFRVTGGLSYSWSLAPDQKTAERPAPTPKFIPLREQVHFETGKAAIKPESYPILDDVVAYLNAHTSIKRVVIEGHTDAQGSDASNQRLSEARAQSVRTYLVKNGITPDRLESEGYGEAQPIADNTTAAGRQQNRRVVLKILR